MSKNVKKIIFVFITASMLILPGSANAKNNIMVYVNNKKMTFDTMPVIKNDRTLVPIRQIFEALEFEVIWNEETGEIFANKEGVDISMKIGDATAFVNDEEVILDISPEIIEKRTMVPLRFIAEATGAVVKWDPVNYIVIIYTESTENFLDSVVLINTDTVQGSGVIISKDGLIATNYHVVYNAANVSILFNDGNTYTGEVSIAGYSIPDDLLILKINKSNLTQAILGDTSILKEGQEVMSVGSPQGILNKVTYGVITGDAKGIIGTTAEIGQGSSGGALFNSNGELVGITSAYSDEHIYYFSISANKLSNIEVNRNLPFSALASLSPYAAVPQNINASYKENTAYISWDPVYGVDGYYVYRCATLNGEYTELKNPNSNDYLWGWGYPYSFGLTSSGSFSGYYKFASVKDGVVSELSEPLYINIG